MVRSQTDLSQLKKLAQLQSLKRQDATAKLATARREQAAGHQRLVQSQQQSAAFATDIEQLLSADHFDSDRYSLLTRLHSSQQAIESRIASEHDELAKATDTAATVLSHEDVRASMIDKVHKRTARALNRKALDQAEASLLDRYNLTRDRRPM